MTKNGEHQNYKRWRMRKNALALSVGTCLVMGILAYEIIRTPGTSSEKEKGSSLTLLPDLQDLRKQRDYAELEGRMFEMKRLMFVRDNALENTRLKQVREKLQEKSQLAELLQRRNLELAQLLEDQKVKTSELEKTATALLDTVDLHKETKEKGNYKLLAQIDELKSEHAIKHESLSIKKEQLERDHRQLKEQLEDTIAELNEIRDQNKAELAHLYEQLEGASYLMALDSTERNTQKSKIHELNLVIQDLKDELSNHENISQTQMRMAEAENHRLHQEIKILASAVQAKQSEANEQLAAALHNEALVNELSQELDLLRLQIDNHQTEKDHLIKEHRDLSKEASSLKKEIALHEEKNLQLEQEIALLHSNHQLLGENSQRIDELTAQLNSSEEETAHLKHKLGEAEEIIVQLKKIDEEKTHLEEELALLKGTLEIASGHAINQDAHAHELKSALETKEEHLAHLEKMHSDAQDYLETVKAEKNELLERIATMNANIEELSLQLKEKAADLALSEEQIKSLKNDNSHNENLERITINFENELKEKKEAYDHALTQLKGEKEIELREKIELQNMLVEKERAFEDMLAEMKDEWEIEYKAKTSLADQLKELHETEARNEILAKELEAHKQKINELSHLESALDTETKVRMQLETEYSKVLAEKAKAEESLLQLNSRTEELNFELGYLKGQLQEQEEAAQSQARDQSEIENEQAVALNDLKAKYEAKEQEVQLQSARALKLEEGLRQLQALNQDKDEMAKEYAAKLADKEKAEESLLQHKTRAEELLYELSFLQQQLKDQEEAAQNQVRAQNDSEKEQASMIGQLQIQLENMQIELEATNAKSILQAARASELEDTLKQLISKSSGQEQDLYNEIRKQERLVAERDSALLSVSQEAIALKDELELLQASNTISLLKYSEENKRLEEKLGNHEALVKKGAELNDQIHFERAYDARNHALEIAELKVNLSQHQDKAGTLQSELDSTRDQLNQIKEELQTEKALAKELKEKYNQTPDFQNQFDQLNKKLEEQQKQLEKLSQEKDEIENRLIEEGSMKQSLSDREREVSQEKDQLRIKVEKLEQEVAEERATATQLNEKVQAAKSLADKADTLQGLLEKTTGELNYRTNELDQLNSKTEAEKQEYKDQIAKLNSTAETLKLELNKLQMQHKYNIFETGSQAITYQETIMNLQMELESIKKKFHEQTQELERLKK